MTNYKFKKGDRVRLKYGHYHYLTVGMVGTVMEDDSYPYVAWDGFTGGIEEAPNWAVSQANLELIEPSVDTFKIGQLVSAQSHRCGLITTCTGVVEESNYPPLIAIRTADGDRYYYRPKDVLSIGPAPTSPAKPECYVTAWVNDDGLWLADEGKTYETLVEADDAARALAASEADYSVAVLKMVRKHSSAVTVTSEDV